MLKPAALLMLLLACNDAFQPHSALAANFGLQTAVARNQGNMLTQGHTRTDKDLLYQLYSIRGGAIPSRTAMKASGSSQSSLGAVTAKLKEWQLPNLLTIARAAMVPVFITTFVLGMKSLCVGLYVASCLTDWLDGYLARKWEMTSDFGAFLDPVADKLMVCSALVLLVCQLPVWWFAVPVNIIIGRELGVSALREWMAERGQRSTVQVGNLGKAKTVMQMLSTIILLYACPGISEFDISMSLGVTKPALFTAGLFLLYVSTALTALSGFQYLRAAWPALTAKEVTKR